MLKYIDLYHTLLKDLDFFHLSTPSTYWAFQWQSWWQLMFSTNKTAVIARTSFLIKQYIHQWLLCVVTSCRRIMYTFTCYYDGLKTWASILPYSDRCLHQVVIK